MLTQYQLSSLRRYEDMAKGYAKRRRRKYYDNKPFLKDMVLRNNYRYKNEWRDSFKKSQRKFMKKIAKRWEQS